MNGKELLELFPQKVLHNASKDRIKVLETCSDEEEFLQTLKELAKTTKPIWIYGFPRTGSSWLCNKFFAEFTESEFFEPYNVFQCPSVEGTQDRINIGDPSKEHDRPEIGKHLGLYEPAIDRLLLAIHDSFVFKLLFDFVIFEELLELFPQSTFIWLVRDGRDTIDSLSKPETKHWPSITADYLGEDKKERFEGALSRWLNFTVAQAKIFQKHDNRILVLKYESFVEDFEDRARKVLMVSNLESNEDSIQKLKKNFSSRHGMWKDWEEWQTNAFLNNGGEELNQLLNYAKGDGPHPWNQPTR